MISRVIPCRQSLLICLGFLVVLLSYRVDATAATVIDVTSTPNPQGSGARAIGMGGAFIAVADDATAASWNPGGLVQLERPEISVVGQGSYRLENNHFKKYPEPSGTQTSSQANLNYLSAAYPFTLLNHNMIVSLNYQHLYDFSRNWRMSFGTKGLPDDFQYHADGGLYAYGIAYAVQIIPQLSFGFTLNIWQDGIYRNGWETDSVSTGLIKVATTYWAWEVNRKERYSFSGFNANVGLLWNITDKLTAGAVFKSPFTANLKRETTSESWSYPLGFRPAKPNGQLSETRDEDLQMPMSYGLGLAYRFSDRFTVSADFYRTEWENFILTDSEGLKTSPISKLPLAKSDINATNQFHLGAEYLFIKPKYTIPVRGGFFYDPAPAQGGTDDYFGFSLGSGIGIGRFVFDVAYQYRFARGVGASVVPDFKFSQNVNEYSFYSSLIIHF
jgi:long-subunit fatty acid transport protein